MRTCPTVLKGFRTEYNFSSGVIQSVRSRMYQYIYKGSGLATNNGILSPYVQYVSQSVGRGWDNPLMSKPKYRKCRKTAVRRAGCCLALCASRAETPRHSSTCPSLPKAGGQQPGWPGPAGQMGPKSGQNGSLEKTHALKTNISTTTGSKPGPGAY